MVLELEKGEVSSSVWRTLPDHRQWTSHSTRSCFTGKKGEGGETSSLLKHSPGLVQRLLPAVTAQHPPQKKQQEPLLWGKPTPKPLCQVFTSHPRREPTLIQGEVLQKDEKQIKNAKKQPH